MDSVCRRSLGEGFWKELVGWGAGKSRCGWLGDVCECEGELFLHLYRVVHK